MKYLLLIVASLFVGCGSLNHKEETQTLNANFNYDDFYNNLNSVNQKMRGDFFADKSLKRNLSAINKEKYLSKLKHYSEKIPMAKTLEKDLKKFEVITVTGYRTTFIFCAYSKELAVSICDDPMCTKIEKQERSTQDRTADLIKELPVKKCS